MPGMVVHAFQSQRPASFRAYHFKKKKKKGGGQGEGGQDLERWLSWQIAYCTGIRT